MSNTIKHFPKVTPQPWKLEVPKYLDMEEEYNPTVDDTQEFYIVEPDDYMRELEESERPTNKYHKVEEE